MTTLATAYEECRQVTRREAKNFYFAFLTLPKLQRAAIYVAYTFCRYCDDAVDEEGSLDQKLAMLTELRGKLGRCYENRSPAPVALPRSSHHPTLPGRDTLRNTLNEPLFLALADVVEKYNIPQEYFLEILAGVESDLVKDHYANFDELRQYCYRVASAVGLVCLHIFGFQDPAAKDRAVDLGLAMQLTNIARDVKEDLEMGRVYLPQDELERFGYSEAELMAGTVNPAFVELMRFQCRRAREYFDSGFLLLPYLSQRSRACPAVLGRLYSRVLDHIEDMDYDVLHHRVSLSKMEKVRVTAQTWFASQRPW